MCRGLTFSNQQFSKFVSMLLHVSEVKHLWIWPGLSLQRMLERSLDLCPHKLTAYAWHTM